MNAGVHQLLRIITIQSKVCSGFVPNIPNKHMSSKYKLVIFVPVSHVEKVREAIHAAGGGKMGNYSYCSFSSRGMGRFKPEKGARPTFGKIGKLEKIEEEKIEILCEKEIVRKVIKAMKKVHPYEKPAYDVYPLENLGE